MGNVYVRLPGTGTILKTENPSLWPEAERVPAEKAKAELKANALKYLRKTFKPKMTIYTVLRHVSSSGMSRRIDLFYIRKNQLCRITGYAAEAMDYPVHKDGGIVVGGCGMDMGYHLVHNLGSVIWPKGTPKPHGKRNGEPDSDGGYALNHSWI